MADFEIAVKKLLAIEGGLAYNPADNGGITNFGISLKFLQRIRPSVNEKDIRGMTRPEAVDIYKTYFWDSIGADKITSQSLANKILDMVVNMGSSNALKIVQRAYNAISKHGIGVDGIMGDETFKAINSVDDAQLLSAIRQQSKIYYLRIVDANPSQDVFLAGWLKRAEL